jgi:phosphoglycerate dehydrogenase-like enzyme
MIVKKTSPGLDQGDTLRQMLRGLDIILEEFDESLPLVEQVAEAGVFLTRSVPVTKEVIDAAPKLKLIQRPGVHVESVDMEYAASKGVPVCHVPAEHTSGGVYVAEHALFLMLAVAKRYKESQKSFQTRTVGLPLTRGLAGKTLGLIGVGSTGRHLISVAKSLGMRVIAIKQRVSPEIQRDLGLDWLGCVDQLEEMLHQSDVVSIHLPMTEETKGYVGRREIGWMKDGAILINIARGPIVDYDALYEALISGKLAGAGLDVWWKEPPDPEDPLLNLDNIIATPHIAAFTMESREKPTRVVANNIIRVQNGQKPLYIVNM